MGCLAYQINIKFPPELSDQQQEDIETRLAEAGLDPFDNWTYAYERGGAPTYSQEQAYELSKKQARQISKLYPELVLMIERIRFCLCCPTEVYEQEALV